MSRSFPDHPTATPDNPLLYDAVLLNQAIECAAAADAYSAVTRGEDWFVHYLLIGTGIECTLKAFAMLGERPRRRCATGATISRRRSISQKRTICCSRSPIRNAALSTS